MIAVRLLLVTMTTLTGTMTFLLCLPTLGLPGLTGSLVLRTRFQPGVRLLRTRHLQRPRSTQARAIAVAEAVVKQDIMRMVPGTMARALGLVARGAAGRLCRLPPHLRLRHGGVRNYGCPTRATTPRI